MPLVHRMLTIVVGLGANDDNQTLSGSDYRHSLLILLFTIHVRDIHFVVRQQRTATLISGFDFLHGAPLPISALY